MNDALIIQRLQLELAPGATIHVVLTPNATAIAQADAGVRLLASAFSPGRAALEVIADDPGLDEFVVLDTRSLADGSTSLSAGVSGGDLRALCAELDPCEIGFTLALLEAPGPTAVHLEIGVARAGDRGLFHVRGPKHFEREAAITVRTE
ncbi:hypothetical protein [Sandaracinus amylolyticus]|uniref:Uncharacterized protein n=1 Tax=Sandaracinus amylolyticus TaxID=927083 RepID=A0A0F6YLP7_9BACT|nr:hypothetical protein [Sandaracinus amylolyticus]AKF10595.1 hypothetical protein DB32_007744 [Sandaracinus amylolyticus]